MKNGKTRISHPEIYDEFPKVDSLINTKSAKQQKSRSRIKNIFTVDVEDYYHVSAFEDVVKHSDWDKYKSRIIPNILSLLGLLERGKIKGTF